MSSLPPVPCSVGRRGVRVGWGEGVSTRGGEEITSIEQMGGCSPYLLGFPGVRERARLQWDSGDSCWVSSTCSCSLLIRGRSRDGIVSQSRPWILLSDDVDKEEVIRE